MALYSETVSNNARSEHLLNSNENEIAWGGPGPAEFDFRSDVITTPSTGMLSAIINTTLGDDVFREDVTTLDFENSMAAACGHEAGAFVISGTMANQLALRALLPRPPCSILTDARAHIIHFEAGGPAFSGAMVQGFRPANRQYMTLADIKKHAVLTDDVHKSPTAVISFEVPTSGIIIPLDELRQISKWTHENGVALHMDGARLFEAVAAGAGSLSDYAELCDAVSLDFSKNLGAPMGAMIVGSPALIHRVRRIRKAVGGGMRQAGVLTAAARAAVAENFGSGSWGEFEKTERLREVHEAAKRLGEVWTSQGGMLLRPIETNMLWVDLAAAGCDEERWKRLGLKHGVKVDGKRIVLHRQISAEALSKLVDVFREVLKPRARL
ncbi:MAG: hypothetical protein M1821_008187 [Bathelium mastoideum]|nr:MAG: hypothetical protein M1821_008187 [Bathelium mastoideum]